MQWITSPSVPDVGSVLRNLFGCIISNSEPNGTSSMGDWERCRLELGMLEIWQSARKREYKSDADNHLVRELEPL